jgi:peptidoglycan/LPS O-acetylase OafA/YrhL
MLQFRRVTTHKEFIPQIDGLRFVAIASVVLFHIYSDLEDGLISAPWPGNGDLAKRGVELFFAISGFILAVPFASRYLLGTPRVDLKQYFLRRLTRLEPPYFISLLVWTAVQTMWVHRSLSEVGPHVACSFLYVHNLVYGAFVRPINGAAWSLEIEIQFYLLAPLLTGLFAIASPRIRRGTILLLMFASAILSNGLSSHIHLRASIAYYLAYFLAGFLVCDLYLTRNEWKPSYFWDLLAACGWPTVWLLGRNTGHIVLPFVIVVLYLAAFRGRICDAVFRNPVITGIGGMCYSIYLFHFLMIFAVKHFTWPLHFGHNFWAYYCLQAAMILPCVLLFSAAFFLVVERPCMDRKWPAKLWRFGRDFVLVYLAKTSSPQVQSAGQPGSD